MLIKQINILRKDETLDKIDKARAIVYLSNVSLSAYKDDEAVEKTEAIRRQLDEIKQLGADQINPYRKIEKVRKQAESLKGGPILKALQRR